MYYERWHEYEGRLEMIITVNIEHQIISLNELNNRKIL